MSGSGKKIYYRMVFMQGLRRLILCLCAVLQLNYSMSVGKSLGTCDIHLCVALSRVIIVI